MLADLVAVVHITWTFRLACNWHHGVRWKAHTTFFLVVRFSFCWKVIRGTSFVCVSISISDELIHRKRLKELATKFKTNKNMDNTEEGINELSISVYKWIYGKWGKHVAGGNWNRISNIFILFLVYGYMRCVFKMKEEQCIWKMISE